MRTIEELLAFINEVEPPPLGQTGHRAAEKLSIDPDCKPEAEDLNTLRILLSDGVCEWEEATRNTEQQHILIVATGAGTGKSTVVILNLKRFIDISPTGKLADEKYNKALQNEVNAIRHRSRLYNIEAAEHYTPKTVRIGLDASKGEVPCSRPHICNTLSAHNYSPVTTFCVPQCERYTECAKVGYLSQWDRMRNHDAVFFSYDDEFFSDPKYLDTINRITGGDLDCILILDEIDPARLPPQRTYSTLTLRNLAEAHGKTPAGNFLCNFVKETSIATSPIQWARIVKNELSKYTTKELDIIDSQLQEIPAYVSFEKASNPQLDLRGVSLYTSIAHITCFGETRTCAVVSDKDAPILETLDADGIGWISDSVYPAEGWEHGEQYNIPLFITTYCRLGFGTMDTLQEIEKLPPRLLNFTQDLRAFVETVNSDTPACHETIENGAPVGWTYYLRPQLNARRGVIISASDIVGMVKELYHDISINIQSIEAKPPAWNSRTRYVQLSTGRYTPARSLIDCDKAQNYKPTGLKQKGRELLQIIATEAEVGKPTLVVGPKAFTAEGELAHLPEVQTLLNMDNVWVINHFLAEGVNEYSHCKNVFVFHYEPRPDEIARIATRIYRNKILSFEREKVTLKKGGVTLKRVWRYKDPLIQAVFDKECEKRMMQAFSRLRPMINEGCNIYMLSSEPIGGVPMLPTLCDISDMQACQASHGTLEKLEVYLQDQTSRTPDEIVEQDRVSKREAYRRSEPRRKKHKAKQAEFIIKMYKEGKTPKEIFDLCEDIKSQKTIYNILNRENCKN